MQGTVFTIGHSTHSQERLLALLKQHGITALCDVRSQPYSRMNPQFNREALEQVLLGNGIQYRFLGKELGARSDDPGCYENGKAQYARIAETELFRSGLERVLRGTREGFRIALMCAEKEPLECHRSILVARQLEALGTSVAHIDGEGNLESHRAALERLARMFHMPDYDLFRSREELLAEACDRQAERIAYALSHADVAAAGR